MPDDAKFGDRLRELREAAGITRYALAKRANLPKQTVYKIEDGTNEPNWTTVIKLADALGVGVEVFAVKHPKEPPDAPADVASAPTS